MLPHLLSGFALLCPDRSLYPIIGMHRYNRYRPIIGRYRYRPITMPVSAECYLLCIMMALDT